MIALHLAKVVAFLEPRGALAALDGAPFRDRSSARGLDLMTIFPGGLADDLAVHPNAELYLGDAEICPAAEGWAVRVLALSVGCAATHLHVGPRERVALFDGSRLQCQWVWRPELVMGRLFRETTILGVMPSTPAARLAAVLNYALEHPR